MRIDHHRRAWSRLRQFMTADQVDRPVRVAGAAVLGSLVLVAVAATVTVVTAPAPGPGSGDRRWVQYAGQEVPVRFLHPEDWQVEVTDTGDPAGSGDGAVDGAVDGTIEISAGGSWARVRAVANPRQLTAEQWAVEQDGVAPSELRRGEVGEEPAAVVERPDERRLYVVRDGEVYELTWRGQTDGAYDEWLAGIEFGATGDPLTDPTGSATGTPAPPTDDPDDAGQPDPSPTAEPGQESPGPASPTAPTPGPTDGPAELTPEEFVALFYQVDLPDLAPITEPPPLTGDTAADAHIVGLAEARGYRLQAAADGDLTPVDGHPAHPLAAAAWAELTEAAAEDGIILEVISGYRSVNEQRAIFVGRLDSAGVDRVGRPYTPAEIAAGDADEAIEEILETSSIPGYSKHHTGYALDVRDVPSGLPFTRFGETEGYEWMAADNFANTTRFGFVPSYPDGMAQQGPMPEEWEFVYVGLDALP